MMTTYINYKIITCRGCGKRAYISTIDGGVSMQNFCIRHARCSIHVCGDQYKLDDVKIEEVNNGNRRE